MGDSAEDKKIPDCKVNQMRDGMANREWSDLGLPFARIYPTFRV